MTTRKKRRIESGITTTLLVTAVEAATIFKVPARKIRQLVNRTDADGRRIYAPTGKNRNGAHLYELAQLREAFSS